MVTDQEMLLAIFNFVGKLSKRLTGEAPVLCMRSAERDFIHIYPH
jgi:hypothetical protein